MKQISQLILLAVITLSLATAQSPKISPDLLELLPFEQVDIIVQWEEPPDIERLKIFVDSGAEMKRILNLIEGGSFTIPAWLVPHLAKLPRVKYISADRGVKPRLDYAVPSVFGDIAASSGWTGDGVILWGRSIESQNATVGGDVEE